MYANILAVLAALAIVGLPAAVATLIEWRAMK